jgi:hypothetical protein
MDWTGVTHVCLHALEGRLRIKVPVVKGAPDRARQLEDSLGGGEGVVEVSANPRTGNVLILYDPTRTNQEQIVDALRFLGYFKGLVAHPASTSARAVERVAGTVLQSMIEVALQRLIVAWI